MTNPTLADIQADIGYAADYMKDGTTAINSQLAKAQQDVRDITATTTGHDMAIRNLACAYSVNAALGGVSPTSNTGVVFANMRNDFSDKSSKALMKKGFSLDGKHIRFNKVN